MCSFMLYQRFHAFKIPVSVDFAVKLRYAALENLSCHGSGIPPRTLQSMCASNPLASTCQPKKRKIMKEPHDKEVRTVVTKKC